MTRIKQISRQEKLQKSVFFFSLKQFALLRTIWIRVFLPTILVLLTFFLNAQPNICPIEPEGEPIESMNSTGPYYVRIYVNVIRDGNGNGGQTQEQVRQAIEYLHRDFSDHNIFFVWDCQINYIDNNEYFESPTGDDSVLAPTGNDTGIRIYLFPDHPWPSATGLGQAAGTAFFVVGNYPFVPFGSLVRSHVISHEMGHCLGLSHTFVNPPQYVDDPDCTHGDYVCDTDADPGMNHLVDPNTCQYQLAKHDPLGVLYDPDEKNIMGYTHIDCMEYFTLGQGQRMRDIIDQNADLQLCLVDIADVVVNGQIPITWTVANYPNGIDITGNLIINGAATLNIEAGVEVRFSENSKLIIKPGGTLNLQGTLTSQCASRWYGVEVWGNPTASQFPDPTSLFPSPQGRLIASGALSRVENADIGIRVYGPTFDKGGGIVICTGTTFFNNRVGVRFAPYENKFPWLPGKKANNLSNFVGCNFLTDDTYPHKDKFAAFLDFDQVRGIDISGCQFLNTRVPFACSDYIEFGYGIYSSNAGFKVNGLCQGAGCITQASRFEGLAYGIYASEVMHPNINLFSMPHTVTQSIFENCFVGLHNRDVSIATVTYNQFLLGNLPVQISGLIDAQIGLVWENDAHNLTIEENDFSGDPSAEWVQIGTVANNLGLRNQVIRRNTYGQLTYNNMAFGANANPSPTLARGLLYECNVNSGTVENDFTVDGMIRFQQGKEKSDNPGVYIAAGNTFAPSANFHWSVTGSNIRYYYNDQVAAEIPDPNKITTAVDLQISSENTCEIQVLNEFNPEIVSDVENVKAQYYLHRMPYLAAKAQHDAALSTGNQPLAAAKGHEAAYHLLEMDLAASKVLRWLMLDTLQSGRDSIRAWMLRLDAYEGDLALAKDYLANGEGSSALNVLDNASAKYGLNSAQTADLAQIREIFVMAIGLAGEPHTATQLDRLEEIAEHTESGYAYAMARNILTRYGAHYPPYFYLPGSERRARPMDNPSLENSTCQVYPNPANQQVLFNWPSARSSVWLVISDVTGKAIMNTTLQPEQNNFIWNTLKVAPGVYFYQSQRNGESIQAGKIIIRH